MLNGKKFLLFLALALAGAISLTGCGGGGSGSSAPTTGTVKFVNNGSLYQIDQAYVALSTSTSWGAQRNSSAIAPGSTWSLSGVAPGTYDSSIVSLGSVSTYYGYSYGFSVTAGNTYTLTATDSSYTGSLVVNNTNVTYPITALYVSTSGYGAGANQLSTSIAAGGSRQIVKIPAGFYYVTAVMNGVNYNGTATIASHSYTTMNY